MYVCERERQIEIADVVHFSLAFAVHGSLQTALIARLEEDLAKSSSGGVKADVGFGSDHLNALLIQPSDKDVEAGSGDSSLAGAVAQQRDRFRQLNVELEGENAVLKKRVASCEADIRTLRGAFSLFLRSSGSRFSRRFLLSRSKAPESKTLTSPLLKP